MPVDNLTGADLRTVMSDEAQRILASCRRFGQRHASPRGSGDIATTLRLIRLGLIDSNGTTSAGEAFLTPDIIAATPARGPRHQSRVVDLVPPNGSGSD